MISKCKKPGPQARTSLAQLIKQLGSVGGLFLREEAVGGNACSLWSEKQGEFAKSIQGHQRWRPGFSFLLLHSVLKVKRDMKRPPVLLFYVTEEETEAYRQGTASPSSARTAGPRTWFPAPTQWATAERWVPSRPAPQPQCHLGDPALGSSTKTLGKF